MLSWKATMAQTGTFDGAREQVVAACRRLAAAGLVHHTAGNISVRVAEEAFAITPTGADLDALVPADVPVIASDGRVIDGRLRPSSELGLHLAVYERHGAGAVVHTHAPICTALSCVLEELPAIHYEMVMLGGPIRVAPYETFATPELAAAAVAALEGRTGALLA